MRVIKREATSGHEVYCWLRCIENCYSSSGQSGEVLAVLPLSGGRFSIIAKVQDPKRVDNGYAKIKVAGITRGFYDG